MHVEAYLTLGFKGLGVEALRIEDTRASLRA